MLEKITLTQARVLLLLITAITFGSAIKNGYAWDDDFVTTPGNALVSKGIAGIPDIFLSKYSEVGGKQFGYRPVTVASFAVEYSLFGFNPHISHFINILLYALLVLLVFKVLRTLLAEYPLWISFLATLVFAIHPLHNEVVVSLKNREEIFAAMCGFAAFWAFLRYAVTGSMLVAVAGLLALLAGFFVKVSVYPFVFLIPFSLWYFEKLLWKKAVGVLGMLMMASIIYTLVAALLLDVEVQNRSLDYVENPLIHTGFWQRVPAAFSVFAQYLKLFVFPYPLLSYYGLGQVALPGWAGISTWVGVVFSAAFGWFFFREFKRNKLLVFALFFMALSIAPFLNLVWLAPGVMAERFAFLGVLGFSVALAWGMERLKKMPGPRFLDISLLAVIVTAFVTINLLRNRDWDSKLKLIETDAAKAPRSVKLQTALAEIYHTKLSEDLSNADRTFYSHRAEEQYLKAIALYPGHGGAHSNLGVLYATQQRLEMARQHLEKAIDLGFVSAGSYYNLGAVYEMLGQTEKAIDHYRKGLALNSEHAGINARLKELTSGISAGIPE